MENFKLLAAIVEHSNDAIIGKTLDGIIISWNAAAARMHGYSGQEIVGKSVELLIPPGPTRGDEGHPGQGQSRPGGQVL